MTLRRIVNNRERRTVQGDEREIGRELAHWLTNLKRSKWRRTSWRHPRQGVERIHYRKGTRCLVIEKEAA